MEQHWLTLIKDAALSIAGLKRYWKVICGFISRVSLLGETREARQIENMVKYLDAVSKNLTAMKRSGVPDETIRKLAVELNVPLIQANLEAMIIARQLSPALANADPTRSQRQAPSPGARSAPTEDHTPPQAP